MSWFIGPDEPVAVEVGECLCPGTPHPGGDTVYLRPELDVGGGFSVTVAMSGDSEGLTERLGRAYLEAGIASWTFLDDAGQPVPCTRENIRRLRWGVATYRVADRAADLYGEAILAPFVPASPRASSLNGRTARRTSRTLTGSTTRRRP